MRWSYLALVAMFCAATSCLSAADVTWVGGSSGAWSTPSNWSGGATPSVTDTAIFDGSGSVAVTSALGAVGGIELSGSTGQNVTIDVFMFFSLTDASGFSIRLLDGNSLTINGGRASSAQPGTRQKSASARIVG